jgi:hypothetical protein
MFALYNIYIADTKDFLVKFKGYLKKKEKPDPEIAKAFLAQYTDRLLKL